MTGPATPVPEAVVPGRPTTCGPEEVAALTAAILVLRARRARPTSAPTDLPHGEWVRAGRLVARRAWAGRADWRWAGRLPGRPRA